MPPLLTTALTWLGIALCVAQSAIFAGLNLAVFSVSKLRLEVEATAGRRDAAEVLELRRDSNLMLATILWGNVTINVLLTLLADSVLTGIGAFVFSTLVITFFGEIVPQAYFARHAVHMAARLAPLLRAYRVLLFPLAKPSAVFLNWWLGPEAIALLRERDLRALITRHSEAAGGELGHLEGIGALNFLDLDDVVVADEGERVDPRSIVAVPVEDGRPVWPEYGRSPDDPFLRRIDASGKKWVIIVDPASGNPYRVIDAHHFLRDVLFDKTPIELAGYCHRPIVITDPRARLGDVIGRMKVRPEHAEDDVIDNDMMLIWATDDKRVITGADLLGRLLRGITTSEPQRR